MPAKTLTSNVETPKSQTLKVLDAREFFRTGVKFVEVSKRREKVKGTMVLTCAFRRGAATNCKVCIPVF